MIKLLKLQNIKSIKQEAIDNLMLMLKPTFRTDSSFKDRKKFDSSTSEKPSFQQNTSISNTTYKPHNQKYTHGIGISLKNIQNRQISVPTFKPVDSQQNIDGYLQKVIKSNLQKISQIRIENEKEKEELLKEIKTLKSENKQLKSRLDQQINSTQLFKQGKMKQLSSSLQKNIITKFATQETLSPNPQRTPQKKVFPEEVKEKTDKLLQEIQDLKKRNAILSVEKRTLASSIQRLHRQIYQKNTQLETRKQHQFQMTLQLKNTKNHIDHLKKQHQGQKNALQKQLEKVKLLKQKCRQIEKEKQKITSIYVTNHQINPKIINDPRITGFVDKRVVKHLECQLKDKDSQIHLKDHLINDLNEKILSNGLSGLNTKYKYLIKA